MIVTGRYLPRRTFLKGLGAAVALPMLDAMTSAFAGGAAARFLAAALRRDWRSFTSRTASRSTNGRPLARVEGSSSAAFSSRSSRSAIARWS